MRSAGLAVLVLATVVGICSCQECTFPTNENLAAVITEIILASNSSSTPIIEVMSFHPVCLAFADVQDRYRGISVVVNYNCTGNPSCPLGSIGQEQIESGCNNGEWSNVVAGATENTRSQTTEASFSTTTREDCSFCVSPELGPDLSIPLTSDSVTHCVDCDSACDKGLMRCFGLGAISCCNYYNNSMCVDECPSPFQPNSAYECVCPVGTTGYNCAEDVDCGTTGLGPIDNGEYNNTSTTVGSVTTYSCNTGYTLMGNATRTCQADGTWSGTRPTCTNECPGLANPPNGMVMVTGTTFGSGANYTCDINYYHSAGDLVRTCMEDLSWSGTAPTCTLGDCESLTNPENGIVTAPAITFNSRATYSCNDGYYLIGDSVRFCLNNAGKGGWNGSEPTCDSIDNCKIPNCEECALVEGSITCQKCEDNFKKDDENKCEMGGGSYIIYQSLMVVVVSLLFSMAN